MFLHFLPFNIEEVNWGNRGTEVFIANQMIEKISHNKYEVINVDVVIIGCKIAINTDFSEEKADNNNNHISRANICE